MKLLGNYPASQDFKMFLDGEFFKGFLLWIEAGDASGTEGKTAAANILHVIYEFTGRTWLKVPLLTGSPVRKLFGFKKLDDHSLEMFVHFEKYARLIRTNHLPVKGETGRITVQKEFVF